MINRDLHIGLIRIRILPGASLRESARHRRISHAPSGVGSDNCCPPLPWRVLMLRREFVESVPSVDQTDASTDVADGSDGNDAKVRPPGYVTSCFPGLLREICLRMRGSQPVRHRYSPGTEARRCRFYLTLLAHPCASLRSSDFSHPKVHKAHQTGRTPSAR